jgi:hypothetical protein
VTKIILFPEIPLFPSQIPAFFLTLQTNQIARNDEGINGTFKRSYFELSQLSFEANSKPI